MNSMIRHLHDRVADGSVVGQGFHQTLRVKYDELTDFTGVSGSVPLDTLIADVAHLTKRLGTENHDLWRWECQNSTWRSHLYSLGEIISQKMCNCFSLAVFVATLLHQREVDCILVDGRVIQSRRKIFDGDPNNPMGLDTSPIREEKGAVLSGHCWNVAVDPVSRQFKLVDTSARISGEPVIREMEQGASSLTRGFTIILPDGRFRHYHPDGVILP